MNTKRANLWDTEAHTHTHACGLSGCVAGRVCTCLRATAVLNKSTSLPRELSAIADLDLHSAASSFWTAVAAVTKQVHFCFSGNKPGSLSRALSDHLNAFSAGFLKEPGHKLRVHVNTVLPQNHAIEAGGDIYDHSNREWLNVISSLPCLWCCWVKILCRTLSFTSFSTLNI